MSKPFSILQISDLHRSSEDPISNDELISAMVSDRDRYVQGNPRISAPDAIIVSGDIIQGVPLGTPNFEAELEKQYAVAETFLDELGKRFVSGDRSRIIIIPGNHDSDWNTAFSAMEEVDPKDIPPNFDRLLLSETSEYRWNMKTRKAYRIVNKGLYAARLKAFWRFFERFYTGVLGLLKVHAGADANLFSLHGGKIAVAAFNSCEGNDCFAYHGMIQREAVSRSYLDLQKLGEFDLQIAVWHHSLQGSPYQTDYMDIDIVRSMIGRGFRLGLYGHQHKAQAFPYQIWLPGTERMAVVSTGSLCAGRRDLPTGTPRQYNILEIAEDLRSVKVHIRAMAVSNLFCPGQFAELGGRSFVELNWEPPKNSAGLDNNTTALRRGSMIDNAEQALKEGNYSVAVNLLKELDLPPNSYERGLYTEALVKTNDWAGMISITTPPASIEELYIRVDAFIKTGSFTGAIQSIEAYSAMLNLPEHMKNELRRRADILNFIKL
jgi:hypothetical protein